MLSDLYRKEMVVCYQAGPQHLKTKKNINGSEDIYCYREKSMTEHTQNRTKAEATIITQLNK